MADESASVSRDFRGRGREPVDVHQLVAGREQLVFDQAIFLGRRE